MSVQYRVANALDIDRVKALNENALPENYPKYHWNELIRDVDSKGLSFVGLNPDNRRHVVGYIIGHILSDYTNGVDGAKSRQIRIYSIATHSKFRRQGIANTLLSMLLDAARPKGLVVSLHVRASNTAAIALYTKHGFETVDTIPEYYRDPVDDGVFMVNRLKLNSSG